MSGHRLGPAARAPADFHCGVGGGLFVSPIDRRGRRVLLLLMPRYRSSR